jgi:hypothetical protein
MFSQCSSKSIYYVNFCSLGSGFGSIPKRPDPDQTKKVWIRLDPEWKKKISMKPNHRKDFSFPKKFYLHNIPLFGLNTTVPSKSTAFHQFVLEYGYKYLHHNSTGHMGIRHASFFIENFLLTLM